MTIKDLTSSETENYFGRYITLVPDEMALLDALPYSLGLLEQSLANASDATYDYRYAVGKWTIKEVLAHLIDTERIFNYRALRIARGDQTPLPGYDHNSYVDYSRAQERTAGSLLSELRTVRASTTALFESFDAEALARKGTASTLEVSVRALGFVQSGHVLHHYKILQEKYF